MFILSAYIKQTAMTREIFMNWSGPKVKIMERAKKQCHVGVVQVCFFFKFWNEKWIFLEISGPFSRPADRSLQSKVYWSCCKTKKFSIVYESRYW